MPTFGDMRGNIRVVQSPSARSQAIRLGGGGQPSNAGGYMPGNFGGGLQLPQGFGGSNAYNIQNMYAAQNQLANHYQQLQAQQEAQNQQRQFSMSGGFDPGPTRQMTAVERGLKKGSDFTQGLVNATGWDPSKGFTLGNIMRFGASLPFQMAQGVTEGSEQLYEAATGRPLLQADSETGLIGTNILDASQRTASLANAGINIGGLFFGGSARAVGTGMNILSKGKAGARMAEGMFGRAMKSPVGQIGFDVAEEGGEEFVQQYLDDTRMKNLDGGTFGRAIEGAKWGALGGGMMSGGSLALRKSINAIKGKDNQTIGDNVIADDVNDETKESWVQSAPNDFMQLQNSGGGTRHMPMTEQTLADSLSGSSRKVPASVTVLMSYADNSLGRNQIRPGAGGVKSMWLSGADSQAKLMKAFRTTDADMMRSAILENTVDGVHYERPSQALDALKQKTLGDERLVIGVGRNPDTQNGGFYMEVVGFNDGDGMDIHPWTAPLVGADFDGDRSTMYWDTDDVHFNGFPVDMMRNPEGAPGTKSASYANWYYSFIEKGLSDKKDDVKRRFKNVFYNLGLDHTSIEDRLDDWSERFVSYNSAREGSDAQASGYATLFTEINEEISSLENDAWAGRNAVDAILSEFETGTKERVNEIFAEVRENREAIASAYGSEEEVEEFVKSSGLESILNRGTLGEDMTKPVQIYGYIGGITYAIFGKGNPFFRQYSMHSFNVHDHQAWIGKLTDFAKLTHDENVFQTLMRASFKLTALGENPLDAIEGLIQSAIVSRTLADWNSSHAGKKIRNSRDLAEFNEIYIRHYNELIKIYNKSKEAETENGLEVSYNEFLEGEIKDVNDKAFIKKWKRSFGNSMSSLIFDRDLMADDVSEMTMDEITDLYIKEPATPHTKFILMEDGGVGNFIERLIGQKRTENNGVRDEVQKFFEEACPYGLLNKIKTDSDGNVIIDGEFTEYHASTYAYIDGLAQMVGAKNAIRAGLYGLEILNTRLGKALFSKNLDTRINAAICISLRAQYDEALTLLRSEDEREQELGQYMIEELSQVDDLHKVMSYDLLCGDGAFFDAMTSLDVDLVEKKSSIDTLKATEVIGADSHIFDLFQDETGDLSRAAMSERIRKANNCMVRSKAALFEDERETVKRIEESLYGNMPGNHRVMFPKYFERMINKQLSKADVRLIGFSIYDGTTVSNAAKEKSRNFASATQHWSTMEYAVNGGYMSELDQILSLPNGVSDIEDFAGNRILWLKALADKDFSHRIDDPVTGKSCFISREAIIKSAGGEGTDWTVDNIVKVLKKYPQITGWISDSAIDPVTTGSGMSTVQYSQRQSLLDGYTDYLEARSSAVPGKIDPSFKDQVDEIKDALEIELLNQTWYKSYITRCIKGISKKLTLPELVREGERIHREALDGFFSMMVAGDYTTAFEDTHDGFLLQTIQENIGEAEAIVQYAINELSTFSANATAGRNLAYTVSDAFSHAIIAYDLQKEASGMGISGFKDIHIFDGFDSEQAAVEGMADAVREEMKQDLEDVQALVSALALAIDGTSFISFNLTEESKARFNDWIDNLNATDSQKEALRSYLNERLSSTHQRFNLNAPDPNILTKADATVNSVDDLGRLRKLWSDKIHGIQVASQYILLEDEYGNFIKDPEVEAQLDKIFSKNSLSQISKELEELRIIWNNRYLSYRISALNQRTNIRVNENAYMAQHSFMESFERFVLGEVGVDGGLESLRTRMQKKLGVDFSSSEWVDYIGKKPPVPNFLDPVAETICGQVFNMDNSGFVEPAVSHNGSKTKQMWGFGYLPSNRMGKVPPREITVEQLTKELFTEESRQRDHIAIVPATDYDPNNPNRNISFNDLRTVYGAANEVLDMSEEERSAIVILHYAPEDNPHGIDDAHTPEPYSLRGSGYKRFRGILGRIIDFSQEGMVLKAKKDLKVSGQIAVKWIDGNYHLDISGSNTRRTVSEEGFTQYDILFSDMQKLMSQYRSEFVDGLVRIFNGKLKDLGMSEEEALILAQGLTPGFIVTVTNADGSVSQHVLDVSHIYDKASFLERIAKITENDARISTVQVLSVTPAEASFKIGRAVSAAAKADENALVGDMHDVAYNAMNNWDDYEVGTLTIEELMTAMTSLSYSRRSPLQASDWRTKMQFALDELTGGKGWANPHLSKSTRNMGVVTAERENYHNFDEAYRQGSQIKFKKGGSEVSAPIFVMRAFLPKLSSVAAGTDAYDFDSQLGYAKVQPDEPLVEEEKSTGKVLRRDGMAAICADPDSIDDALTWGRKTRGTVFFTKEIYDHYLAGNKNLVKRGEAVSYIGGSKRELVWISPARDYALKKYEGSNPHGSRRRLAKSEIKCALMDYLGEFPLGDANAMFFKPMFGWHRLDGSGISIKLSDLFSKVRRSGDVTIASKAKALEAINLLIEENDDSLIDWKGVRAQDKAVTQDDMVTLFKLYKSKLERSSGDDSVLKKDVSSNDIIGFAVHGDKVTPIFLPGNAPKKIVTCRIGIDQANSSLNVMWDGEIGFDTDSSTIKSAIFNAPGMKVTGMLSKLADDECPYLLGENGQLGDMVDMVVTGDTEGKRNTGFEGPVFAREVWYALRWLGGSLLYERSEDGSYKTKDFKNVNQNDIHASYWTEGFHDQIMTGAVNLVTGHEHADEMNAAIRKVLANCKKYRLNIREVLSTYNLEGNYRVDNDFDTEYMMVFDGMGPREIAWFAYAMNPKLINAPGTKADGTTLLDTNGNTRISIRGTWRYLPARWGNHMDIGDESSVFTPSGVAAYAHQHMYRRAADIGYAGGVDERYMDTEWADAIKYADYLTNNHMHLSLRRSNDIIGRDLVRPRGELAIPHVERFKSDTWSELSRNRRENEIRRDRTKIRKIYDNPKDKTGSIIENPMQDERIMRALGEFRTDCPGAENLTWAFIMMQVDRINGYTRTTEANHIVDIATVIRAINQLKADIKEYGMPIMNHVEGGKTANDRFALAALSDDEIDIYWQLSQINQRYSSKAEFKQAVLDNARNCLEQVKGITGNKSKKLALLIAYDVDFRAHGEYNVSDYIANGISLEDLAITQDRLLAGLIRSERGGQYSIDPDVYKSLSDREQQALVDVRRRYEASNFARFELRRDEQGRAIARIKAQDGQTYKAVLNSATEVSKIMALSNPAVTVSNLIDRGTHQGIMNFAIWLGNKFKIGPYASENPPQGWCIDSAVESELFLEMFSAFRMARVTGDDLSFLANAHTIEEIREWKADRMSKMTPFQKFAAKVYNLQTGSDKFIKGQARNMLYRFAQFAEADPEQSFWFKKDANGLTLFESMISDDEGDGAARWFVELLGSKAGRTPSFTTLMKAVNSAQQGDMAQKNVLAMVLENITGHSPLAKFIVTTTISRFPDYTLNVTNRMLNWVLPMSSIYYVMTERIAEHGHKKAAKVSAESNADVYVDPHYERAHIHRNLKEAMLVDITHLGVGAVALILLGMSGGIEPPDDEKKWGNTDEWLIFGMRVKEAWWLQDILGIALPLAAYTKSAQLGKPRMDILVNGITDVCCSNPIIKVADAVGFITDPENSFTAEYDRDYEQYQNAKEGAPGFLDWVNANGIGFGLNWVSQFFTPSFVREWYQNAQQWERSYKRVYQTNPDGSLSEAGKAGYTEYTTYADAQIRKATRRNPMLGFLADLVLNPTTGYMAGEMPMTVYTDDYQREAGEYWSINGLAPKEQQAKILEIICEIQSYDDIDSLVASGFYLDNETRAALGSTCWDIIHEFDNWYYGLQSDGMLDYYALGNGNFNVGQQIGAQIKLEWQNQKQAWSDFYYDKVCKLPTSITTYNRYNTTYERDVYGNVYATGYRRQGFMPFISAPGTTTNPEGTAGYENDFMTPSAVTGLPLNQRALVPTKTEGERMPSLEAWSGDGNGGDYSQLYNNWYGGDGTTGEGGTLPSSLANTGLPGSNTGAPTIKNSTPQSSGSSKKSSRSSGGGGGYRRRSGGGGGGGGYSGSPSIYARYQSPYAVTANVMGRTQHSRANFDYLRPGFETKGSRESYKREDI